MSPSQDAALHTLPESKACEECEFFETIFLMVSEVLECIWVGAGAARRTASGVKNVFLSCLQRGRHLVGAALHVYARGSGHSLGP